MNKKNINNIYLYIIFILILFVSIGFAFLSRNLNINGSTIIRKTTWDIYFDNLVDDSDNLELNVPATISDDKKSIDFEVTLKEPGDEYYFYVDIVNSGTIRAMLDNFEVTGLNDSQKKYIDWKVTYNDGVELSRFDLLDAESEETIKVTVRYIEDVNAIDLPSQDEIIQLTYTSTYIQTDERAKERVHLGDDQAPKVKFIKTSDSIGNIDWYKNIVITAKVIDSSKLSSTKYCLVKSGECSPNINFELGENNEYKFEFENSNDAKNICIEAIDSNNNRTLKCTSDAYTEDLEEPVISSLSVMQVDNSLTVDVSAVDNLTGIEEYYYSKDGGVTYITSKNSNYTFSSLEAGKYNIVVYVKDNAGNISEVKNYEKEINLSTIKLDYNYNILKEIDHNVNPIRATGTYENGIMTVTATDNDGYVFSKLGADLEVSKDYYIKSDISSVWGTNNVVNSQEIFVMNLNLINLEQVGIYNSFQEFRVKSTATHILRFDVNTAGQTESFSNIFLGEYINKYKQLGNKIGNLPEPTRDYYTFLGWYSDEALTQKVTEDTIVTEDMRLYAKWRKNKVSLKYNTNGGTFSTKNEHLTSDGEFVYYDGGFDFWKQDFDKSLGNDGLANWNNGAFINIQKTHYQAKSTEEWNTKDDGSGQSFDQTVSYTYGDICDARRSDCEAILYVNWELKEYTVELVNNLFNADTINSNIADSGLTVTYSRSDQSITLNGTITSMNSSFTLTDIGFLKYTKVPGKFVLKSEKVSGTCTGVTSDNDFFLVNEFLTSENTFPATGRVAKDFHFLDNDGNYLEEYTFNTTATDINKIQWWLLKRGSDAITFNNYKIKIYVYEKNVSKVKALSSIDLPNGRTRLNYTNKRWYTEDNPSDKSIITSYQVKKNTKLYAVWEYGYYFDVNGSINGTQLPNTKDNNVLMGTFDIYVNGNLIGASYSDYYQAVPPNATVEVKNIKTRNDYTYVGEESYKVIMDAQYQKSITLPFTK